MTTTTIASDWRRDALSKVRRFASCAARPFAKGWVWAAPETTRMRFIGIVTLATALSCTPGLAQTTPTKASANAHREFTCLQMAQEGRATSKRGFAAPGLPAGRGGVDSTELAPAIVIVWPVSSNIDDKQRSDKIAFADHEMDALELASIASQCSIRFQRPPTKG